MHSHCQRPAKSPNKQLAGLIATIGTAQFDAALTEATGGLIDHDAAAMMIYFRAGPPRVVIDRLVPGERSYLYGDYLAGVYRLSPFYRLALAGRVPCVARIRNIAPDNFRTSEYYRRYFGNIGVSDMLGVLLPRTGTETVFLSFSRRTGMKPFGRADQQRVESCLPILAAAAIRDAQIAGPARRTPAALPPQAATGTRLTARETEVVDLILGGHSTRSIADSLKIAVETVRVHRRHIYEKLDVGSQAELFSWFLRSIGRDV